MRHGRFCLILSALLLFVSCGKSGPPLAPYPHTPQPVSAFRVSQRGDHIEIAYTTPRATVSGDRLNLFEVELYRADTQEADFGKAAKSRKKKVAPGETIVEEEPLPTPDMLLRFQAKALFRGASSSMTTVALLKVQPEVCAPSALKGHLEPQGVSLEWEAPDPMPTTVPPPVAPAPPKLTLPAFLFPPSPSPSPGGPSPSPGGPLAASPSPSPGGPSPSPGGPLTASPSPASPSQPPPSPSPELLPPAPQSPLSPTSPSPSPSTEGSLSFYPTSSSPSPAGEETKLASPGPSPLPSPALGGFLIYRRPPLGVLLQLPGPPIPKPAFVDLSVKPGETWCYVVRTEVSLAPLVESRGTNEVCIDVRDITPPAPPVGLSVLPREGKLELTWSPSPEPDLARYRLYRASGGPPSRIAELPKTATTYLDASAERGATYYYTLTAVDESGNESTPSSPAEGRLP